jgi:hypothetical protein
MLSKKEEELVEHLIELLQLPSHADKLVPERVLWLAKKLKETNDELAKTTEEYQKMNEEYSRYREMYD